MLISLILTLILTQYGHADRNQTDFELVNSLLSKPDITYVPEEAINLTITLYLRKIVNLDEKNKVMLSDIYVAQTWVDKRLAWQDSFSPILYKIFPAKKIWLPDTTILNTVDGDGILKVTDSNYAIVSSNGTVYIILSVNNLKTKCKINARKFPFDEQVCSIIIGSWTLSTDDIEIADNEPGLFMDYYMNSSTWDFLSWDWDVNRTNERFTFSNYFSKDLEYIFVLRRKPLYFMINGVFPCLVLNVITLLAFFLPFASQVSIIMTSILTYSVYSLRVANDIPVQSDYLPLITVYFLLSSLYSLLSLVWFQILNKMILKSKIPKLMEKLCLIILRKRVNKIKTDKAKDLSVPNDSEDQKTPEVTTEKKVESNLNEIPDRKKQVEKIWETWNYFVFVIMFLFIFTSNLGIWITIGS